MAVAKSLIRAAFLQHDEAKTPVWLDIKKTHKEHRPGRLVRLLQMLVVAHLEKIRPGFDVNLVTVDIRTRALSISNTKVAWISKREGVEWAEAGTVTIDEVDVRSRISSMVEASQ